MPCNDSRDDNDLLLARSTDWMIRRDDPAVALLCGVMHSMVSLNLSDNILDNVDWKEVGLSREYLKDWWKKHLAEDQMRKALEAAEKARLERLAQIRKTALDKLTPEEKSILGL